MRKWKNSGENGKNLDEMEYSVENRKILDKTKNSEEGPPAPQPGDKKTKFKKLPLGKICFVHISLNFYYFKITKALSTFGMFES